MANEMIDLSKTTIMIPLKRDSKDRSENFHFVMKWLRSKFRTNIIVCENSPDGVFYFEECERYVDAYIRMICKSFHRTAMLNSMAREAKTPVIAIYDADTIVDPPQSLQACQDKILSGEAFFGTPFNSENHCVFRTPAMYNFFDTMDHDLLSICQIRKAKVPFGGIVFCNREMFWECGGENENFVAYGPEDQERWHRWGVLGCPPFRVHGTLYHFEHERGPDSSRSNPATAMNELEWAKMRGIVGREQMISEIDGWDWNSWWKEERLG